MYHKHYHSKNSTDGELDLMPLLDGLAETLLEGVNVPEVSFRHIFRSENGNWKLNEDIIVNVWYPGGESQTCVLEITCHADDRPDGMFGVSDYYQLEYYMVPMSTFVFNENCQETGDMAVITECNNVQFENWYHNSGLLSTSQELLRKINQDEEVTDEIIRNKYSNPMERRA